MITFDERRARELAGQAESIDNIIGSAPEPGVLSGVLGEIPRGVGRGLAAAQAVGAGAAERITQPIYNALGSVTGETPVNPFGYLREQSDATVRALAPDPLTVGAAGQIVNGVATIATEVAAGAAAIVATGGAAAPEILAGGATAAGLATGRTTYNEMLENGVDPSTAVNAGFIDAVTTGSGALLPAGIGFTGLAEPLAAGGIQLSRGAFVGANAALGAGVNVATGIIQRGATQDALERGGYDVMARQYAPMDSAALAADGILGGIFSSAGSLAALPSRAAATVDAALAARDAKHAAITTAPGIPSDPGSAAAHGKALGKALRDVWDGSRVDVSGTGVQDHAFVFGPRDATASNAARAEYGEPATAVQPSTRLAYVPQQQRATLPYNAPELDEYAAHIEQQYGLPPGIIVAIKNAGERSNSNQVSPAGARGVMQFTPENLRKYGVTDPTDPVQMIDAAGRYLRDTAKQYGGDVDAMIADYNGGPRQAREVLAGRKPKAPETQAYLQRVREALGRQGAGQRAPDGAISPVPQDRARAARAIETEIDEAQAARADLLATAGDAADLGQVRQIQEELSGLLEQRSSLDADGTPRDRAKEIQASGPNISYKQALSQANREISGQAADLDTRISRLQAAVDQNRGAAQALQNLAELDQRIADLSENRAAIDAPASPFTPVSAALREAAPLTEEQGQAAQDADLITQAAQAPAPDAQRIATAPEFVQQPTDNAPAPASEDNARAPSARPQVVPESAARSGQPENRGPSAELRAGDSGGTGQDVTDDIETRAGLALLDERGDITIPTVDENGNEVQLSLRQALDEANAELEYVTPEALDAAIMCQLRGGA